jgi:hypothetical protein
MLVLLSSDTNIALLKSRAGKAGFSWQEVARKSIWVESFHLYRLTKGSPKGTFMPGAPGRTEIQAALRRHGLATDIALNEALATTCVALDPKTQSESFSRISSLLDQRAGVCKAFYLDQAHS